MNTENIEQEILELSDILLQINDLNKMITLHKANENNFMLKQYQHRKEKCVSELNFLLKKLEIFPNNLVA